MSNDREPMSDEEVEEQLRLFEETFGDLFDDEMAELDEFRRRQPIERNVGIFRGPAPDVLLTAGDESLALTMEEARSMYADLEYILRHDEMEEPGPVEVPGGEDSPDSAGDERGSRSR